MSEPDAVDDADDLGDLGDLAAAYAAALASSSAHPIAPTTLDALRDVLSETFAAAVDLLGGTSADGTPPEVEVTTSRDDLPAPDPREPGSGASEVSTTRRAVVEEGAGREDVEVVLHETSTRSVGDEELRTTIALTGAGPDGGRFWLGATSYAGEPVDALDLLGELPSSLGPLLGQVLTTLRQGPPRQL